VSGGVNSRHLPSDDIRAALQDHYCSSGKRYENLSIIYSNKLTGMDISKNNPINNLISREISSRYKVCIWVMPFPPAGVKFV
jgi:hypothetical protein